jgi:hypothetical protein
MEKTYFKNEIAHLYDVKKLTVDNVVEVDISDNNSSSVLDSTSI